MKVVFQPSIFRGYVSFREGTKWDDPPSIMTPGFNDNFLNIFFSEFPTFQSHDHEAQKITSGRNSRNPVKFHDNLNSSNPNRKNTHKTKNENYTVDGRNPAPVEVGSLSHYLQGFIHPRWCRISSINSITEH